MIPRPRAPPARPRRRTFLAASPGPPSTTTWSSRRSPGTRSSAAGGSSPPPPSPPEAHQRSRLGSLLANHVAPGYVAASGLLTRYDEDSDFGSHACVYKDGLDPETGTRYLEEIAFEVITAENEKDAAEKAVRRRRRGVRRVFSIRVEGRQVAEWSAKDQLWEPLAVLARRGLAVSEEQRQEILACRDLDRLERKFERAFEATAAAEVLAEG